MRQHGDALFARSYTVLIALPGPVTGTYGVQFYGADAGGDGHHGPASTAGDAGDAGDDIVYAKVHLNQSQPVTGEGLCYNGSRTYYGPAFSQDITPTRLEQTWWVGPGGTNHN